jgi:hypothetical protein
MSVSLSERSALDVPQKLTGFADVLPWLRHSMFVENGADSSVELGYAFQLFDESVDEATVG